MVKVICPDCELDFKSRKLLTKHRNLSGDCEFFRKKCELCQRRLKGRQTLLNHMRRYHSKAIALKKIVVKEKELFIDCKHCGKQIRFDHNWKSHTMACYRRLKARLRADQKEADAIRNGKQFQCNFCEKIFALKGTVLGHLISVHNSGKEAKSNSDQESKETQPIVSSKITDINKESGDVIVIQLNSFKNAIDSVICDTQKTEEETVGPSSRSQAMVLIPQLDNFCLKLNDLDSCDAFIVYQ